LETKAEVVPKTSEKAIQIEAKPKPPKKKIFEFRKSKQVSEIDEEAKIPKVKHDPVLFLLAATLFIFLFSGAYILLPGFSVAAMLLGGFLVM